MAHPRVFCVRNDRDDNFGIAVRELSAGGVSVERVDGFASDVRWPELDEIGGLVVFGGEMNVDDVERHPYLLVERELMRSAVDAGVPVLGICLGAQMLARALGARVYRAPVREVGFKPVRLTEAGANDRLLRAFGTQACVFEWHEDTFDMPAAAELLAVGDEVRNQAFRYRDNAWGAQFHFEVDQVGIGAWLEVAGPSVEQLWQRTAREIRDEVSTHLETQQQLARQVFAAFAETVRIAAAATR